MALIRVMKLLGDGKLGFGEKKQKRKEKMRNPGKEHMRPSGFEPELWRWQRQVLTRLYYGRVMSINRNEDLKRLLIKPNE